MNMPKNIETAWRQIDRTRTKKIGQFYYCLRSERMCQRNLYEMWSTSSKLGELQTEFIGKLKDLVEVA